MPINRINHAAALVGGVVYFLLGRAWYAAFESSWLRLIEKSRADVSFQDPVPYVVSFAMGLVVAYALAILLTSSPGGIVRGIELGALIGVAFVAASMLVDTLYEGRTARLWLLEAGYPVVGLTIVGAIVGAWKRAP